MSHQVQYLTENMCAYQPSRFIGLGQSLGVSAIHWTNSSKSRRRLRNVRVSTSFVPEEKREELNIVRYGFSQLAGSLNPFPIVR